MDQLSATRSELIARRLQIGLATQGRDLLKEKRAALVVEFGHLSTGVLEAVEMLGRRAAESAGALSNAVAFDGPEAVGSAAERLGGRSNADHFFSGFAQPQENVLPERRLPDDEKSHLSPR